MMRLLMQLCRKLFTRPRRHSHSWLQRHCNETSAPVLRLSHCPTRLVEVVSHDESRIRAEVQIPEHMAGRQRRDEQFLWVVTRWIAAEGRVRGGKDQRLT